MLISHWTCRSVRYRYWCRTELTEVSVTGIDLVSNIPKCRVPIFMLYRTYRSVRYRYWCRTELTEVSGTGIDVVPNLPKRPLPVIPAVCLGTYSTEHTFVTFFCLLPIFEIHKILHNKRPTVKIALIANLSYGLICGIWWSVDGNATWHLLNNHSPSSGSSRAQTRQKPDKNKKQRKGEHARKSAAEAKRYCCS